MKPGDMVTWLQEPRGGYGYVYRVPAVVVRVTEKRVVIDVHRHIGGWKRIAVRPEHIARRETP